MAAAGAGGGGGKKKKSSTASQPAAPAAPAAPEPEPPAPEPVKADPPAPGAPGTSKKAKAKAKAEAAAAAEAAPPPPPEPQPKAKAKAKGKAEPQPEAKAEAAKPKAEAKAKSQPKAEAKSQPKAEAKSQPKAEAKGKAKAEPKKEEPLEVEEVKPEPKAASKKKSKSTSDAKSAPAPPPKVEEEEEVKPKKEPDLIPGRVAEAHELNAADWEEVKPGTKKDQRRKERKEEEVKLAAAAGPKNQKLVPGMAPPEVLVPAAKQKPIPGMAPAKELKVAFVGAGGAPPPPVAATQEPAKEAGPPASMATVKVPEKMIGVVIGPKGATLNAIKEKTGVKSIDTSGDTFTIVGPEKGVALAELAIQELASKGYASLLIDNFAQAYIQVHPVFFPEIIGKEGKVIRTIQEKLGVRVQIPETPKDAMKEKKKYRINLAGSDENVQKAKQVLTDIITVYHSEITHEGIVHEEMEIDEWNKRFIIGKGGCEIRHIQHNFKVRLYIPNENSVNDKTVIVGERHAVDRAKTYIEKVLWNAENIPRGREANSGAYDGDTWGEEEAAEPWMDAYLYKRK